MSDYHEAKERLREHRAWAIKEYREDLDAYAELDRHWRKAFEAAHEAKMVAICPVCGEAWRNHEQPRMSPVLGDILSYGEYVAWLGRKEAKERREAEIRKQRLIESERDGKIVRAVSDYQDKKTKRIEI